MPAAVCDEDEQSRSKGSSLSKDLHTVHKYVFSSYLNILLLCVPLGFSSAFWEWGPVPTFTLVRSAGSEGGGGGGGREGCGQKRKLMIL